MDSSSSKLTPRYMPRKDKTLIWKDTCTPMFIVALITVAKTWKPLNALQWIKLMWYICTVEKYTTIRNNEITPFAATWMDLENILLSKVSSVQFSHSVMSDFLRPRELQHTRPPCPSPTPRVHSNSHPLSQWCHPVISSSVVPFSSCPQSLPASEFF